MESLQIINIGCEFIAILTTSQLLSRLAPLLPSQSEKFHLTVKLMNQVDPNVWVVQHECCQPAQGGIYLFLRMTVDEKSGSTAARLVRAKYAEHPTSSVPKYRD